MRARISRHLFRAAVVSAPVVDVISHAGTSDSGWYVTPYAMDGEFPDCRDRYVRVSPITGADRVRAPVLFLQGEEDLRCPLGQTEQMFATIVRRTDAPARMVVYPGGSHSLATSGRPAHRLDYHRRIPDWLGRWVVSSPERSAAPREAAGECATTA